MFLFAFYFDEEILFDFQTTMTVCKVLLFGLKPCDISSSTNEKIADTTVQRQHSLIPTQAKENSPSSPQTDYLHLDIKPLVTPTSSVRNDSDHFLASFFDCSVLQPAVIPVMNPVQFVS